MSCVTKCYWLTLLHLDVIAYCTVSCALESFAARLFLLTRFYICLLMPLGCSIQDISIGYYSFSELAFSTLFMFLIFIPKSGFVFVKSLIGLKQGKLVCGFFFSHSHPSQSSTGQNCLLWLSKQHTSQTGCMWTLLTLIVLYLLSVFRVSDWKWSASLSVTFYLNGSWVIRFHNLRQPNALILSKVQGKGGGFPEQALNAGEVNKEMSSMVEPSTTGYNDRVVKWLSLEAIGHIQIWC